MKQKLLTFDVPGMLAGQETVNKYIEDGWKVKQIVPRSVAINPRGDFKQVSGGMIILLEKED